MRVRPGVKVAPEQAAAEHKTGRHGRRHELILTRRGPGREAGPGY